MDDLYSMPLNSGIYAVRLSISNFLEEVKYALVKANKLYRYHVDNHPRNPESYANSSDPGLSSILADAATYDFTEYQSIIDAPMEDSMCYLRLNTYNNLVSAMMRKISMNKSMPHAKRS